jgi:hypothetical protein
MGLDFEWDRRKAEANLFLHGVSFAEASTVFGDRRAITIHDPDHSTPEEDRFLTLGASTQRRLLVVVHCDRGDRIRLISARKATPRERNRYDEQDT